MSTLTTYDMEQRSPEWYAVRCGMVTASTIGSLVTVSAPPASAYKCPECSAAPEVPCASLVNGKAIKNHHPARSEVARKNAATATPILTVADDDTSRGLLTTLAAERITGRVEETPVTGDMIRGIEHEPFAKDVYADHYAAVEDVGFMVREFPSYRLGCSPDGLVGDEGMVEVKCPRAKAHIATVLAGEVPAKHMAQLQAALIVSGREWIDFVSFHGGLPLFVKRVHPDPTWAAVIHEAAAFAERLISEIVDEFTAATRGLPATTWPDLEIRVA